MARSRAVKGGGREPRHATGHVPAGGCRCRAGAAGADGPVPADLQAVPQKRQQLPTFAEYVPVVSAAVSDGCRRAYSSYWNRIIEPPRTGPGPQTMRRTAGPMDRPVRGPRSAVRGMVPCGRGRRRSGTGPVWGPHREVTAQGRRGRCWPGHGTCGPHRAQHVSQARRDPPDCPETCRCRDARVTADPAQQRSRRLQRPAGSNWHARSMPNYLLQQPASVRGRPARQARGRRGCYRRGSEPWRWGRVRWRPLRVPRRRRCGCRAGSAARPVTMKAAARAQSMLPSTSRG
jgi:hypothetical protein